MIVQLLLLPTPFNWFIVSKHQRKKMETSQLFQKRFHLQKMLMHACSVDFWASNRLKGKKTEDVCIAFGNKIEVSPFYLIKTGDWWFHLCLVKQWYFPSWTQQDGTPCWKLFFELCYESWVMRVKTQKKNRDVSILFFFNMEKINF